MPWYGDDASQYRISMGSYKMARSDVRQQFVPFVPKIYADDPSARYGAKKIITSVAGTGRPYAVNSVNDDHNYDECEYHGYPSIVHGDDGYNNRINHDKKEGTKPFLDAVKNINHDGYGGNKEGLNPSCNRYYYSDDDDDDDGITGWRNLIDSPVKKGPSPSPMVQPHRYGDYNNKEGHKPKPNVNPIYIDNGYGSYDVGNGKDKRFLRNTAEKYGYNGGYKPREYEYGLFLPAPANFFYTHPNFVNSEINPVASS